MSKEKGKVERSFKKGESVEEVRSKREQQTFQLRKNARESQIASKRRANNDIIKNNGDIMGGQGKSADSKEKQLSVREQLAMLPQLAQGICGNEADHQFDCTVKIRRLLSIEQNPPIQDVIQAGVVPRLIEFLTYNKFPTLQFEAAWALTNIASGSTDHTQVVVQGGAVQLLVQLLRSPNDEVREQAVWALGNIAGDSYRFRDLVLDCGALQPLIEMCRQPNIKQSMLRNATWTLSNLCRGKPQPKFELVQPALPTLAALLHVNDDDVLTDACWALSYLTDDDSEPENHKIEAVLQSGVAQILVNLLMHPSNAVRTPALRTVGNIVTGNDQQTERMVKCGALRNLGNMLSANKKSIKKEACWAISNITAGDQEQIQQVIDTQIFPELVNVIAKQEFDIAKEAVWAICNATNGGNKEQIRFISQKQLGAVQALCRQFQAQDVKIVQVALEGLENMLKVGKEDARRGLNGGENIIVIIVEECGGLDALEGLQSSRNQGIYEKSQKLIVDYFGVEGEDESAAPQVASDGSTFSFGGPGQGPEGSSGFTF